MGTFVRPKEAVVTNTITNVYHGHEVHGDWTEAHGILYWVEIDGERHDFESLGDAIAFCADSVVKKPAQEEAVNDDESTGHAHDSTG